jgi:hypothetical protein
MAKLPVNQLDALFRSLQERKMPTAYIIIAVGFADDSVHCPHAGQYLESFDHDAYDGRGYGTFTSNVSDAKRFNSAVDAMTFWNLQSCVRPLRPDGQPNKPLTALTIAVEALP